MFKLHDLEGARKAHERGLAIRAKLLGDSHPDTAFSFHNLGAVLKKLGEPEEALRLYERALAPEEHVRRALSIGETTYEPTHHAVAEAQIALGRLLYEQGEPDEALRLIQRALAAQKDGSPAARPIVALALTSLASIYLTQGRVDEAKATHGRALAMTEAALGRDDAQIGTILDGLGQALLEQGDYRGALAAYQRERDIAVKLHGAESPWLAPALLGSGRALARLGRAREAQADLEDALRRRREALGDGNPLVAAAEIALAEVYEGQGQPKQAITLLARALPAADKHPRIAAAGKFIQARALWTENQRSPARKAAEMALAICAQIGDKLHQVQIERWLSQHPER